VKLRLWKKRILQRKGRQARAPRSHERPTLTRAGEAAVHPARRAIASLRPTESRPFPRQYKGASTNGSGGKCSESARMRRTTANEWMEEQANGKGEPGGGRKLLSEEEDTCLRRSLTTKKISFHFTGGEARGNQGGSTVCLCLLREAVGREGLSAVEFGEPCGGMRVWIRPENSNCPNEGVDERGGGRVVGERVA